MVLLSGCLGVAEGEGGKRPEDTPAPAATSPASAAACKQGALRCDGGERQSCNEGSWVRIESCLNVTSCEPEGCKETTCTTNGELRCTGRFREVCDITLASWRHLEECLSDADCSPERCK